MQTLRSRCLTGLSIRFWRKYYISEQELNYLILQYPVFPSCRNQSIPWWEHWSLRATLLYIRLEIIFISSSCRSSRRKIHVKISVQGLLFYKVVGWGLLYWKRESGTVISRVFRQNQLKHFRVPDDDSYEIWYEKNNFLLYLLR